MNATKDETPRPAADKASTTPASPDLETARRAIASPVQRLIAYGAPAISWCMAVAVLATCHFIDYKVQILQDTENGGESTLTVQKGSLGLTRSCHDTPEGAIFYDYQIDEIVDDDRFLRIGMAMSIIPVVLGCALALLCCGPVLLDEFEQVRNTLLRWAVVVYGANAVWMLLTLLAMATALCDGDLCASIETEIDQDILDNPSYSCTERCTASAGVALAIVSAALWVVSCRGTLFLLQSGLKPQAIVGISSNEANDQRKPEENNTTSV